jgi:hypothetical protein
MVCIFMVMRSTRLPILAAAAAASHPACPAPTTITSYSTNMGTKIARIQERPIRMSFDVPRETFPARD